MRRTFLTLLLAMLPAAVGAQHEPAPDRQTLPRDVRREVADRWNGENALRASDRVEIAEGREVAGNVAVQRGPLVIAGHVTGSVLALNADVILRPSARIDGELLVVGGEVDGRNAARVDGAIRIYRQALVYREDGERIVPTDDARAEDDGWWRRIEHRGDRSWSDALRIVQAGPYNRVEGLPVEIGPALYQRTSWGSIRFDGAAIVRTGSSFDHGDFGHSVRAETRFGGSHGIGVGARVMNVVDPIESWQMSDIEVALASFLARRDYRDYFQRHGDAGFVTLYGARDLSLTGSFGEERWSSRVLRNPFTIFNDNRDWRQNPTVDEGLFHIGTAELKFDTRSNPDDPWAGWYVNANVEHGRGSILSAAPTSLAAATIGRTGVTDYTRGFFDFRRYNRLGPEAQLNMRVVLGGWLNGDQLPLERRLSVDGPGALPGFGFRSVEPGVDVGTCNTGIGAPGRPAECDRIALAQLEYRGDLRFDFTGDWSDWPRHYHSAHGDVQWVFFADAGRGWMVGQPDGALTYDRNTLPPLSTFRSDIGLGLDFGGVGVYCAKAVSTQEPVNFFVRLRHRF
jgi:hypothetical protein